MNPKKESHSHLHKAHLHLTVNEKRYDWHQQYVTGAEIRKLGNIAPDDEIYLAIQKPWEPELILDDARVNLARPELEHFYSKPKPITFIVNGREKQWADKSISFEQLVILALGKYDSNPNKVYTITYDRGQVNKPEGSMVRGNIILVKTKMIFNVRATDKS